MVITGTFYRAPPNALAYTLLSRVASKWPHFFCRLTVEQLSRFVICPIHYLKALRLSFPTVYWANNESTFPFYG